MIQNKRIEVYEFFHKDVKVIVKIDYVKNQISLMEENNGNFQAKNYVFSNRGVGYMSGWTLILDAMREAILDAKDKYEKNLAEVSSFKSLKTD